MKIIITVLLTIALFNIVNNLDAKGNKSSSKVYKTKNSSAKVTSKPVATKASKVLTDK
jgi:hypothetical protein